MALTGIGMCVGNVLGGKLADYFPLPQVIGVLLLLMATTFVLIYGFAASQTAMLVLCFFVGAFIMMMATPIQMLMITTATGAEIIASSVLQACFNIGNALGAFLGGLPLVAGYGFASPQLVGVVMAVLGSMAVLMLLRGQVRAT